MTKTLIKLSDHFDYGKLLRFALPPISTMIFSSLYGIVDGYFVSNYVGATAFASLNLVMPFIMMIAAVGFMFGSGGSALVGYYLGLQDKKQAVRSFSMLVYAMMLAGVVLASVSFCLAPQISVLMGADSNMLPYCVEYLRINMVGVTFFMMQQLFQSFLITAEKPRLGFRITLIAGCTNMVLDWLLVGILKCGLAGAAWATTASQMVGGLIPFVYFLKKRDGVIYLCRTSFEPMVILKTCGNGISEFLSSISASIVGFLYNLQLLRYAGENGVAAYGVIMYVSFIFVAIYIGYTMGVSPVVSYHYGASNRQELQSLYSKSMRLTIIGNAAMFLLSEVLAVPLAKLFVGYQPELYRLTVQGLRIYSIAFLAMGINTFASAFFTALNDGRVSAILSVSRTLFLQLVMIYLLPALMGTDGLWCVVIAVEGLSLVLTMWCLNRYSEKYGYRALARKKDV